MPPRFRIRGWQRILSESVYWNLRCASSRPVRGVVLALWVMAVPYVERQRRITPYRVEGFSDLPAHLGNLLYWGPKNLISLPWNLLVGKWTEAQENLAGILGIRTRLYQSIHSSEAVNMAEWYAYNGLWIFCGLFLVSFFTYSYDRIFWRRWRHRRGRNPVTRAIRRYYYRSIRRRTGDPVVHGLNAIADTLGYAFTAIFLLANSARAFQEATGLLNWVDRLGNAFVTILDLTVGVAWIVRDVLWNVFYFAGPGKSQAIGFFTGSQTVETVAHYLDNFPLEAMPGVFSVALYYAFFGWIFARVAYFARDRWWRTLKRLWRRPIRARRSPAPRVPAG